MVENFKSEKDLREFLETEYEQQATQVKHAEAVAQYELEIDVDNVEKKAEEVKNKTQKVFFVKILSF